MRVVMIGISQITVMAAGLLLDHGHEVVIVELDKEKIDNFSDKLDCGFIHGDGSTPAVLRELYPEKTNYLFCLTSSDQTNIITALVGKSLRFNHVVPKIENEEFEFICKELGLEDTIVPSRTIGRFLSDMVEGKDVLELSTIMKGDARFFSFIAKEEDQGMVEDLKLPEDARVISIYRDGKFQIANSKSKVKVKDEVVILTHSENLKSLQDRWKPKLGDFFQ